MMKIIVFGREPLLTFLKYFQKRKLTKTVINVIKCVLSTILVSILFKILLCWKFESTHPLGHLSMFSHNFHTEMFKTIYDFIL